MLDKAYRPQEVEGKRYQAWEEAGAFACGRNHGKPFTIVIPPPNVTGSLHMGHALNCTLQDILIRYHRMNGRDTLWQPGMDHAGIATQMVVERQLAADGGNDSRREMGREAFVKRVWQWKEDSGGTIVRQLRRLGASCDWSRERFTMDEGLSAAVRRVFVKLHEKGLIYKDKRLVNWDCTFQTAISDLEVEQRQVQGQLWYFKYAIEGAENTYITVATTRPETMLGDTAVAVHPDDERYRDLVGGHAVLPLVGRRLPIIADQHCDPEKGSGAVKITPAHDFNDFEVGRRHGLEMINIFDQQANINGNAPEAYRGLNRYEARARVVADLEVLGLVDKIEEHILQLPYGDRSNEVVEPRLTEQWYVDAETLAKPAIEAVEQGRTKFVPQTWERTYFQWMRNIQPWCISRQLWWGHRIPAWYGPDGDTFVAETEAQALAQAEAKYGRAVELEQDPDVLDTWFSSALWPFSTLGWPEETPELARYYPTDVLVTGFDIIFFWVARMMMTGIEFMGEPPFHTVYINGLIRDAKGQKMSKSKNNTLDPLEFIDKYGADALRFTLTAMEAQGGDIKLAESRVEGYRNFVTKLWNAARFCDLNGCRGGSGFDPAKVGRQVNRWIVGKLAQTAGQVTSAIEAYRFNDAAHALYHFTWGTFCDWYLEFIKESLMDKKHPWHHESRQTAGWVLDNLLALLHPVMPFVTEELWQRLAESAGETRDAMLMLSDWPELDAELINTEVNAELDWLCRLIEGIRSVRTEMNVPAAARIHAHFKGADEGTAARFAAHHDVILRLARLEDITALEGAAPEGVAHIGVEGAEVLLLLGEVIDLTLEKARLARNREAMEKEIGGLDKKLANEKFLEKAPPGVIEEQKTRREEKIAARDKLQAALDRLGG